jgi:NAD(P)-dependent dehydrogenase (short-subunit alcohol dehydrogenase family)
MTTAFVTGASDGIGLETARGLLKRGWRVLAHGRDQTRAAAAVRALQGANGMAVPVWGDLADMDQVWALSAQARRLAPSLDLLVNNAGVFEKERRLTKDGFERTLAINHFAHWVLTQRLKPALQEGPGGRVVWVSSQVHVGADLPLDDLDLQRAWSGYGAYGASKLANAATAAEQARRPEWKGVLCFSLHPGVVATKLLHQNFGAGGINPEAGARTSLFCALQPRLEKLNGGYFKDSAPASPNPKVLDPGFGQRLWDLTQSRVEKWLY